MSRAKIAGGTNAIGYVRVSTGKQDHEHQRNAIAEASGREGLHVRFIEEEISSRKEDRQIYAIVDKLRPGETVIVYELSRLARSLGEVFTIVQQIRKRGAALWVLKPEIRVGNGANDMQGDMMLFALGIGAQIERDLISERTKTALAAKRKQGVVLGRPRGKGRKVRELMDEKGMNQDEIRGYLDAGVMTIAGVARMLGVDARTVTEWLRTGTKRARQTGSPARNGSAKRG